MPSGLCPSTSPLLLLQPLSLLVLHQVGAFTAVAATASPLDPLFKRKWPNPLGIDLSPAPSPEDGPAGARYAIRNPAYLPAEISAIVGSYAFSLVLVAVTLLALSKRRRERLKAAAEDPDLWEEPHFGFGFAGHPDTAFPSQNEPEFHGYPFHLAHDLPKSPGHVRNFSLPSPTFPSFQIPQEAHSAASASGSCILPSPTSTSTSTIRGQPGVDPDVDQTIVQRDRAMAQAQLEDMYKYVMEQEAAKEAGVEFHGPQLPTPPPRRESTTSTLKKGKNKPANLDLNKTEKPQSRASSILSALKSPRKKKQMQCLSISSPIMTPMSGTFPPQYTGAEMNAIPPRHYAPAQPPPPPSNQLASFSERQNMGHHIAPMTPPDMSPESTQSIDERLRALTTGNGKEKYPGEEEEEEQQDVYTHEKSQWHARHASTATTEVEPISAISETSQTPLVRNSVRTSTYPSNQGLPSSPKPGVNRFPSLPSSPKPGVTTFSRPNAPSAVRTGGALPLRAYEPALASPNTYDRTVKQTVFERSSLSGARTPGLGTARTPLTGNPMPYSPYQPYTPVVPITPSLVTKADRKRMKRFEPKTPTLEMVKNDEDIW